MTEVVDLLAQIDAEKRAFAQTIWPPATPDAVARLRGVAPETLGADLPEGYVSFLARHDGLDFNGFVIYGATEHLEPFLSGIVEANDRLGGQEAGYVFYGDAGDRLYAQDRASGAWVALDGPSLDVIGTFPSFDAMLARALRDAVEE
jgi:hypothetical protein